MSDRKKNARHSLALPGSARTDAAAARPLPGPGPRPGSGAGAGEAAAPAGFPGRRRPGRVLRLFGYLALAGLVTLPVGAAGLVWLFWHYGKTLPDYQQLATYQPPVTTRVHAGDGSLIAEYATERRVFVPVVAMPALVREAFISAEDKRFNTHHGLDPAGLARAVLTYVLGLGRKRLGGTSTITQQVAKTFLLSNERSLDRKIREAILAIRLERAYSKDRILELYLNEIYLGRRSYGVAAAAINYFDKSLDELTLAEAAFLAGLPKAPGNYNPQRYPEAARIRRNYVLNRLRNDGKISDEAARQAAAQPIVTRRRGFAPLASGAFFAEEIRRELVALYGENSLYQGGLSVRTTLSPRLQAIVDTALRDGLIAYDTRHGWRGPVARVESFDDWRQQLAAIRIPDAGRGWRAALVTRLDPDAARVSLSDGTTGLIPFGAMQWARPWLENQQVGEAPRQPADVLQPGDVVVVEPLPATPPAGAAAATTAATTATTAATTTAAPAASRYALRQIPSIQGAAVVLDPHTGRVLAMSGGFDHSLSQFNRAVQARRQPGSAFKPFVYMAGLEAGMTPSTIILDAPYVIDQGAGLGKWKPANFSHAFHGPSPMRLGIEQSRNLMTVRLAATTGMARVADHARRFGIHENLTPHLAMSLGAGETTLLKLATAYGMIVNGGRKIAPTLIDRVQDRHGRTVFRHDRRTCAACRQAEWDGGDPPTLADERPTVVDPAIAYQMVSMLQGVVQRGTGRSIARVGKPLAGKTGTSNDAFDTWFVGFSPDLVAGVFIGFDQPRTLGRRETGSSVAAPVFRQIMARALAGQPVVPFRVPPGIRLVRVNPATGLTAGAGEGNVILEAFRPGQEPGQAPSRGGSPALTGSPNSTNDGGSGIY